MPPRDGLANSLRFPAALLPVFRNVFCAFICDLLSYSAQHGGAATASLVFPFAILSSVANSTTIVVQLAAAQSAVALYRCMSSLKEISAIRAVYLPLFPMAAKRCKGAGESAERVATGEQGFRAPPFPHISSVLPPNSSSAIDCQTTYRTGISILSLRNFSAGVCLQAMIAYAAMLRSETLSNRWAHQTHCFAGFK